MQLSGFTSLRLRYVRLHFRSIWYTTDYANQQQLIWFFGLLARLVDSNGFKKTSCSARFRSLRKVHPFVPPMVGSNGLEPSTSRLSGVCSNQLSYEPVGPLLLKRLWWRLAGSNRWPPACRAGALPAELNPHESVYKKCLETLLYYTDADTDKSARSNEQNKSSQIKWEHCY